MDPSRRGAAQSINFAISLSSRSESWKGILIPPFSCSIHLVTAQGHPNNTETVYQGA